MRSEEKKSVNPWLVVGLFGIALFFFVLSFFLLPG